MPHNLLTSAHSFLSYSHSKLILHLSSPPSPVSKESSDLLLKAVLIQNAMDSVDSLVKQLEKEKIEKRKIEEERRELKMPVPRTGMRKDWFEVIAEEEEEEEEEDESIESSSSRSVPSTSSSSTLSTSVSQEQEEEWFEETWQSLQADASPTSTTSSELEPEWDGVEVQIVAVPDSDSEDEDEDQLEGFSLFAPLPSPSSASSSSSSSFLVTPSIDARQEIYSEMPSSPILRPMVIYDKMYVAPTRSEVQVAVKEEVIAAAVEEEVVEDQVVQEEVVTQVTAKEEMNEFPIEEPPATIAIHSFDSFSDSEPEFDSDSEEEDEDDDSPITPQQDLIDDFDMSPPPISNKTNTGVFTTIRKGQESYGDEHREGGCGNCSACLGRVEVGDDEVIF